MILYFTGTGNSRYIAEKLADRLQEELLSVNDRLRANDTSPVHTGPNVILVTPTYAWRIPRIVRDWLLKTELTGAKQIWFVMDCGDGIGNAGKYNRNLCSQKAVSYMGTAKLVMPENYIALFTAPGKEKAQELVQRAEPAIAKLISLIQEGRVFPEEAYTLRGALESGPVNPLFYALIVKAKPFWVKSDCIGCGSCVKLCPLNNIRLQNGRPIWGSRCTHCMACISDCPVEAIEYGRKTVGKVRYHCEHHV